jgi:hypothetical protein
MAHTIEQLVEKFAEHVIKQDAAETVDQGNRHALATGKVFDELAKHGDAGRDALSRLFSHPHRYVRCLSATFLLGYKNEAATAVLKELSRGTDLIAFGAEQSIKNWQSGDWELDPNYLPPNHPSRSVPTN